MRTLCAGMIAACGMAASTTLGVVNTTIVWELSTDNINYAEHNAAAPLVGIQGGMVYARAVVSYISGANGTVIPLGLASLVFQPTVSNYRVTDTLMPFVNNGMGSNTSDPLGVVTNNTDFGRLRPFGRTSLASSNALFGHIQDSLGTTYLRISQRQNTSFIGGVGNTSGNSGVPINQLPDLGRTSLDPAFNPSVINVEVFRFAIRLGIGGEARTLRFDSPTAGFGNLNTTTGEREVHYFASPTDASGQIRGTVNVIPAYLGLPEPSSGLLLIAATALGRRRR